MNNVIALPEKRRSASRVKKESLRVRTKRLLIVAGIFLAVAGIQIQHGQYRQIDREIGELDIRVSALERRTEQSLERLNLLLGSNSDERMI